MEGRINDDNLYMRLSRQNKILINYVQSREFGVRTYAKCKWPLLFKLKKLMPKLTQSPPRFCCIKLLVQSVVQET